jgi:hypothetical protein
LSAQDTAEGSVSIQVTNKKEQGNAVISQIDWIAALH